MPGQASSLSDLQCSREPVKLFRLWRLSGQIAMESPSRIVINRRVKMLGPIFQSEAYPSSASCFKRAENKHAFSCRRLSLRNFCAGRSETLLDLAPRSSDLGALRMRWQAVHARLLK
jgi:hypothetical protein